MAERVHFLGKPFNFDHIDLSTPNGLQGGSYFTKLTHNSEPLYVQTPKCGTRQGIVINGKKAHYDILLDSASNTPSESERTAFVGWLERVEERVVQLLHDKGSVWFTNELSIDDIRSLFTSPIKSSRGGTQFLIRANVAPSKTSPGQFACSVYDEHETQTNLEYIKPDHAVISIIEVTGVRFTSRSFQLELASKQMAVLANKPIFETCIINKNATLPERASPLVVPETVPAEMPDQISKSAPKSTFDLDEIDLGVVGGVTGGTNAQSIHIKSPVEVYYAMYRAAIKRAREAKKIAIESYLDAKNIKNVYKLNLVDDDSDDDDDDEDGDEDHGDGDNDNDNDDDDDDEDDDETEYEKLVENNNTNNNNNNNVDGTKKLKLAIQDDSVSLNISDGIIAL